MEQKIEIITRVLEPFHSQGAKTITMDDVAELCGISKKTLYKLFPNKEKLLFELVEFTHSEIEKIILSIVKQDLNAIEELLTIHYKIYSFLKNDDDIFMYQLQKYYPKVHKFCYKDIENNFITLLIDNIQKGKKLGYYRPEVNEQIISRMLFLTSMEVKTSDLFSAISTPIKETKLTVIKFYLHGLMSEKGKTIYQNTINQFKTQTL